MLLGIEGDITTFADPVAENNYRGRHANPGFIPPSPSLIEVSSSIAVRFAFARAVAASMSARNASRFSGVIGPAGAAAVLCKLPVPLARSVKIA